MKIGIIGHEKNIELVQKNLGKYDSLYLEKIIFNNEKQKKNVEEYLKIEEEKFDGFIFTGKIPFMILNKSMVSKKPWVYLEYDVSSLVKTLYSARVNKGYSPERVSLDSFDRDTIKRIYKELKINYTKTNVMVGDIDPHNSRIINSLIEFHKDNYWNKGCEFCITGISDVSNRLRTLGIPVMDLAISEDNISKALQTLQLKSELSQTEMSQIVVVDICIDIDDIVDEDEYIKLLKNNEVVKEIFKFAGETQSAITEDGKEHYKLFCTKNTIEMATDSFTHLKLLNRVKRNTGKTLSVGIGYGITVREAKLSAEKGRVKAQKKGGDRAYVVRAGESIGPINNTEYYLDKSIVSKSDYERIARDSGMSIRNLTKIHNAVMKIGRDSYSSRELALESGISLRNMNRLIKKLEENGFVECYGKRILGEMGRPSRIIRINFNQK